LLKSDLAGGKFNRDSLSGEIENIDLEIDSLIVAKVWDQIEGAGYDLNRTVIIKSRYSRVIRMVQTLDDMSTLEWYKVEDIIAEE